MTETDREYFELGDFIGLREQFDLHVEVVESHPSSKRLLVVNQGFGYKIITDKFFLVVEVSACEGYQEFGRFTYKVLTSKGIYSLDWSDAWFFSRVSLTDGVKDHV